MVRQPSENPRFACKRAGKKEEDVGASTVRLSEVIIHPGQMRDPTQNLILLHSSSCEPHRRACATCVALKPPWAPLFGRFERPKEEQTRAISLKRSPQNLSVHLQTISPPNISSFPKLKAFAPRDSNSCWLSCSRRAYTRPTDSLKP